MKVIKSISTFFLTEKNNLSPSEGRKVARSCDAKFIEASAGIEHNVDELLVGVLKQIRLRIELETMSSSKKKKSCCASDQEEDQLQSEDQQTISRSWSRSRLSSPLRTLQVARDILSRACLATNKGRPLDCENLHIL